MDLVRLQDFDPSAVIAADRPFANLGFDLRFPLPGMLTYGGTPQFLRMAASTPEVAAILTTEKVYESYRKKHGDIESKGIAFVASPRTVFFRFHNFLCEQTGFYRRPEKSHVGADVRISPTAVVSRRNVSIGDRVVIGDHAVIHDDVTIGDDVSIGTGSVIGGPGFQYLRCGQDVIHVRHAGGVSIASDVQIHAQCTIDRAIFNEDTEVGQSCKLDNGVHFAHRSRIGKRGLLAARACICGGVVIGDDAWIGPAAVLSNGILVGDRAQIAIGAVVVRDVRAGEAVAGNFAIDHDAFIERNLQALFAPAADAPSGRTTE